MKSRTKSINLSIILMLSLVLLTTACLSSAPTAKEAQDASPVPATTAPAGDATPSPVKPTTTPAEPSITPTSTPFGIVPSDFPVYPGGNLETETNDLGGRITLTSRASWQEISPFYEKELAAGGWTLLFTRYSGMGGPLQTWKKGDVYLVMSYDVSESPNTVVTSNFTQVKAADARAFLPPEFILPETTNFLRAGEGFLDLLIPLDYTATQALFQLALENMTSLGWQPGTWTGMTGSGEPITDPGSLEWPAGVTPMPLPTADGRGYTDLVWVAPNKDEYKVTIFPEQNQTRVWIDINFKDPDHAGLPSDVVIYEGSKVTLISLGALSFEAPDNVETVTKFYEETLTAAGWELTKTDYELKFKKGDVEITIMIFDYGDNISSVSIFCPSCTAPKP